MDSLIATASMAPEIVKYLLLKATWRYGVLMNNALGYPFSVLAAAPTFALGVFVAIYFYRKQRFWLSWSLGFLLADIGEMQIASVTMVKTVHYPAWLSLADVMMSCGTAWLVYRWLSTKISGMAASQGKSFKNL